jgi:hypothetical protein
VSYRPELPVPDWPGARRAAAAAEPSNGLALLDGWGVGRAGDGPPRLERWWPRGDDGLVPDEGSVAAGSGGRLRVLGIDVFGGRVVAAAGGG